MLSICKIPITFKEGAYRLQDFSDEACDSIEFEHDTYGDTLTYTAPVEGYKREIVLYGIPKEEFWETVSAEYDAAGKLLKISALIQNKQILLYIYYADADCARQKIKEFALKNADAIAEEICKCKEVVSRLFVEYYYESQTMDFHALIGSLAQKEQLLKEHPKYHDIVDYPGDYPSDLIKGDNDALLVMINCVIDDNMHEFFQYAVEIMEARIQEKAIDKLRKTDDFKFISMEYD